MMRHLRICGSRRLRALAALAVGVLAVSSCGGSAKTAGIEGTGLTVGAIAAFGSVFVNGVEYRTTTASFKINGQAGSESQLRVGQVVTITGSVDAGRITGTASAVSYKDNLQGPVSTIDFNKGLLTVLGQTVRVDVNTSLAKAGGGALDITAIAVGNIVTVSGFMSSSGELRATRLELTTAGAATTLEGSIQSVDAVNRLFQVKSISVDYSSATLVNFPSGRMPQAGDAVRVGSASYMGSGTLLAQRVEYQQPVSAPVGNPVEIEGLVTRFASLADFDIGTTHVGVNADTVYQGGTAANVTVNVVLDVQGRFDANQVLIAAKVSIKPTVNLGVIARVEAVNAASNSLTVFGISVTTNAFTRFEDDSDIRVSPFNLSAVRVGDYLDLRGSSDGSGGLVAAFLERENAAPGIELSGVATAFAAPNFTLFGKTVNTNAATTFRNDAGPILAADFFAQAVGRKLRVRGAVSGAAVVANEVKISD